MIDGLRTIEIKLFPLMSLVKSYIRQTAGQEAKTVVNVRELTIPSNVKVGMRNGMESGGEGEREVE